MKLTLAQLQACMPYAGDRGPIFLEALNAAMDEFQIDTLLRQASFIAQVAHESGSLKHTAEIWGPTEAQRGYEGRRDLGNTHIGDGRKYLGRGLLQITGRSNTTECLRALGRSEDDVGYLETPIGASRTAAWFWRSRGLNEIADQGSFGTITKKINGGYNGLDDRIRHYVRCRKALNI
jgi:putative chitinase